MLLGFFRYFRGWIRIEIIGDFAERFLNLLMQEGIKFFGLRKHDACRFSICVPARVFRRLRNARRRTRVRLHILERHGFPFKLWRYRRRWGLVVGAVVCTVIVVLMSQFVWSIEFEGTVQDRQVLLDSLAEAGLREGVFIPSLNLTQIEQYLLADGHNLAYAAVLLKGTHVSVQVIYATEKPEIASNEPCNLIAAADGVITYMQVLEGVNAVKAGDAVKKGDILVSGVVDSEQVGYRLVHSDGRIYAQVAEEIVIEQPYELVSSARTGESYKRHSLRLFNFSINFWFGGGIKYPFYDKIEKENIAHIGQHILPLAWTTYTYHERVETTEALSPDQAEAYALRMLEETAGRQFFGTEFSLQQVTVEHREGLCIVRGGYICTRNIAQKAPIVVE